MSNKLSLIFLFLTFSTSLSAQNWEKDWATTTKKASAENKKIVLVFSGSDWCIPCIKLEKEIWENKNFIDYANKSLVLYRADFPKRKKNQLPTEKSNENNNLASLYNPKGYFPWVQVLSPDLDKLGTFIYEKKEVFDYIKLITEF